MEKQIITINLPTGTSQLFEQNCSVVQVSVSACHNIYDALNHLETESFLLVIMDTSRLSSGDTQAAVRVLREVTYIPILLLSSAKAAAAALEVGADVCIPPSAEPQALFSQAMALIRRYAFYNSHSPDSKASIIRRGDLEIDLRRYRVTLAGEELHLQRREFRLLAYFARRPGVVLTYDQISAAVWMNESTDGHNINSAVAVLRRELNDNSSTPSYIETIHGVGYRFLPSK